MAKDKPSKDVKTKKPAQAKPEDAEKLVLDYLRKTNRPYSATDVSMNLHNAISKPNTQKILQVLADRGDLLMKIYGKQSVFVVKQDTGNVPSAEVLAEMDGQIEQLKERVQGVKDANRLSQNEFNQVTATPPTNTLAPLLANLQTEIQTLSTRLIPLRTGANPITPAERKQIDTDYTNMRKEWQKRRKWFKNLWGMIEEGSGMTDAKELFERLGIEEDDVPFDEDPLKNIV